jgi:putative copper resistance protein D
MTAPSPWILAVVYWLHMLATVVWIGGLAALALIVQPAARRALDQQEYAALLAQISRRLQNLGWFSLIVLAATGMVQLSANPHYQGLLVIGNRWAAAILIKHLTIGLMVILTAYLTWGLTPRLNRLAFMQAHGMAAEGVDRLRRRELLLLRANLALSVVILALTALARAS